MTDDLCLYVCLLPYVYMAVCIAEDLKTRLGFHISLVTLPSALVELMC